MTDIRECDHGARVRRYGKKNDLYWTAYMCPVKECAPDWLNVNDALLEWVKAGPAPSEGHIAVNHPGECPRCNQMRTEGGKRLHEVMEDHEKCAGPFWVEGQA